MFRTMICGAVLTFLMACRTATIPVADSDLTSADQSRAFQFLLEKHDADESIRALYFDIYYALQNYVRHIAKERGELYEFNEAFDESGTIELSDAENTIKCSSEACDLKLESANLASSDPTSAVARLFQGIALGGSDDEQTRQVLGQMDRGPGIICTHSDQIHRCQFNLFRKSEAAEALSEGSVESSMPEPGLENCTLHDLTVRQAQAALAELVDGGLLPLYAAPEERTTVGYVRYSQEESRVLFVDTFLCGRISHSYFYIGSDGEDPTNWVADPSVPGNAVRGLSLFQDEAELQNTITIVKTDADSTLLEIDFAVKPSEFDETDYDPSTAVATAGAGKFYMHVPALWTSR